LLPRTSRSANFVRLPLVPYVGVWMLCAMVALFLSLVSQTKAAVSSGASILNAADAARVIPATVFFRGQVASVQARNSAGVKLSDGMLVLCALVDTSGYSTAVQQKYQGYFITEAPLDINGQMLKPGAYGVGFIEGTKFIVMDLGAHDLFTVGGNRDAALKRPTPLQILADTTPATIGSISIGITWSLLLPRVSKRPDRSKYKRDSSIEFPIVTDTVRIGHRGQGKLALGKYPSCLIRHIAVVK
jgi:hypothetical protein